MELLGVQKRHDDGDTMELALLLPNERPVKPGVKLNWIRPNGDRVKPTDRELEEYGGYRSGKTYAD